MKKKDDTPDNVIQMPRKRMRKLLIQRAKENQRTALAGSIITLVLTISIVNKKLLSPSEEIQESPSRGIASVKSVGKPDVVRAMQERLRMKLKASMDLDKTELARQPTSIEDLQFGELSGKYKLGFQGDKINSLEFLGLESQEPMQQDVRALVDKYSKHWSLPVDRIETLSKSHNKEKFNTYHQDQKNGEIHVEYDSNGKLLRLNIISI